MGMHVSNLNRAKYLIYLSSAGEMLFPTNATTLVAAIDTEIV